MSNSSSTAPRLFSTSLRWILFAALIAPLLYYWIYAIWINPSANYYTNDAEFPHFMNSLAPFKGGRYGYIDHPGTPVQILGTVLLGFMYPFARNAPGGFVFHVLEEPGRFLDVAHAVLMLLYLGTTLFFFWMARSSNGLWRDILYAGGLAVLYYAIHPDSLSASTVWNHNSFNFPFGATLLLCLYGALTRDQARKSIPLLVLVGLGVGAGIMTATTIYMAGWVIAVVTAVFMYYLLQKNSWIQTLFATALTGLSAIGGFFLSVIPIMDKMSHFRNWIISLLTHESNYLDVPDDQPRLERLASNFFEFQRILPTLFVFFILLVIVTVVLFLVFRRRLADHPGYWAVTIGLAAQSAAILIMFLDRPLQEAYFLSIAAILPVWTLALYQLLQSHRWFADLAGLGLVVFAVVGMTLTVVKSVDKKQSEVNMLRSSQEVISSAIQRQVEETGRSPDEIIVMWMYGSYSPCWALRLGDSKAFDIFTKEIEQICPNQYLLNNGLRVSKFGNNFRIENEPWDIVFGCKTNLRHLRELQLTLHVEEHPELQWMCGVPVVITHE